MFRRRILESERLRTSISCGRHRLWREPPVQSFETAGTLHNRCTEYVKAPEMLTLSNALKKDATDYNRQKQYKCGRSADIWALGCLLYEIIVGELCCTMLTGFVSSSEP